MRNVTNGTKYITNLLKKYKNDDLVKDKEIYELAKYHPTKTINIGNIEYFTMKIRPPYNKLGVALQIQNRRRAGRHFL